MTRACKPSIWSGLDQKPLLFHVRRSSAVLFELIDGAKSDLIVMSFASFRIPEAEAALHRAVERGVRLDLILETQEESSGRYHQFGAPAYGAIASDARVSYYSWARTKRPLGPCSTRRSLSLTARVRSSRVPT